VMGGDGDAICVAHDEYPLWWWFICENGIYRRPQLIQ
jgi:hypothetical protein